jgi:hypothetical protein
MAEMLVEKPRLVQLLDSGQADRPDDWYSHTTSPTCALMPSICGRERFLATMNGPDG